MLLFCDTMLGGMTVREYEMVVIKFNNGKDDVSGVTGYGSYQINSKTTSLRH